jgi:signal transduction histidine kinase/ligand-binding sensor domain-containing protein/DNA-binding response OmpR family regulator
MWFATDDGLYKFDGTNFTVYRNRSGDSTSLLVNEVLALHEDKTGNLWIGTSGGGFSLYNRRKDNFSHFPENNNTPGFTRTGVIRSICSDYRGKIWIAHFDALYSLDPQTHSISKHTLRDAAGRPVKTHLISVFADSKHRLWIATDDGLFCYHIDANTFIQYVQDSSDTGSLISNQVRTVGEDKWGAIWVGTTNGLSRLKPDGSGFLNYHYIQNTYINCIACDKDGLLWIGTGNGLYVLDINTNTFTVYSHEPENLQSLTSNWIRCAYIDRQGIYWFGTYRGGINKYDKNLNLFNLILNSRFQQNRADVAVVSAMAENKNGNVLMGTDGNGLYEFDRRKDLLLPVNLRVNNIPAASLAILALHRTRNNQLYIGTYAHGLLIIDQETGRATQLVQGTGANNLTSNDIFCLQEDSKGNIWIGTNGNGLNVVKNGQVIARYAPQPRGAGETLLPINGYIRAIEEDAAGNIWIGTHGGGIAVYQPGNGKWTIYDQENSHLPSNKIQSLHRDGKGRMWIGSFGGGLAVFDQGKQRFTYFNEHDGLQNTMIHQIVEDDGGQLWMSTNTGISCFNTVTKKFRNFTTYNDLQNSNFVRGSGIRLSDGELLFGGQQGFNYFNPATLTVNRNDPTVVLTDLKIYNKSVAAGSNSPIKEHISVAGEIRLDYKQNFALSFVALNYTLPRQNGYAYKLDGFDKDWNYTGALNTASYTNLDPGQYVFRVKASNNDGVWSKNETRIKIYVRPPFWRTPFAYLFYVLAAGGLLLYIRNRGIAKIRQQFTWEQEREQARRIRELDRLKLKFLTNLSHDFRTPISLIMGPVEQLINEGGAEGKIDKLNMIRRNARRLLNLVNQLLDFRKMEEHELRLQLSKGDFVSFVKEVSESFRDMSERKHIGFIFSSSIDKMDALFDHDKIERVLFNLLSNAFKFTLQGGMIRVEVDDAGKNSTGNNRVSIKVIDTGIGIPKDKQEEIFERFFQNYSASSVLNQGTGIGLSITKEFIRMHGGEIEVESEPGQGSVFTILLPLTQIEAPAVEKRETQAMETMAPPPSPAEDITTSFSVLLVEDNEDFRFYLKDNLRNNYKILEAVNGREGWQKALACHPQVIVSDISMPEMDGIELVKKLKADKRTSHIPVILLTALTGDEQQIKGLETGANDYITKPFNFEVLNAKIKSLLELKNNLKSTYTKQIKVLGPETAIGSTDERLLQEIVSFLETNLTNPQLSVEGLSKQVGMSRSTLYSKLLQLTGETPVEYIRSFRLNKAAVLLQKSNMTISEIAYQVGFTTPNYFAKSFKSKFNMLPSEYIARNRKEKG